jgi:lipopolysaccharide transport system ATP-binding protein
VYLNATILGMQPEEMKTRIDEIEAFADIGDFIDQPVKTYSSGMLMRLAFATQTALDPDILIVDEALAVGDMAFQIKCFARMNQLREKGTTILFVSHSLGTVLSFCDKALYLRQGEQITFGSASEVARQYERDCLDEKMVPRHSKVHANNDVLAQQLPVETYSGVRFDGIVAALHRGRHNFQACVAGGAREGSKTATIESFVLTHSDGTLLETISPHEDILGLFRIRFNSDFEGCIHLSIQILDKCGSPILVIRDSNYDEIVCGKANSILHGAMRFVLPLQAGVYYCRIAVLLFPAKEKYKGGQFNFEQAEVADLIEHGAQFEVLQFVLHPISSPVLSESKLTLIHMQEGEV